MRFEGVRRADWQRRLAEYIQKVQHRKFRWGRFDCCLFAAGAVKAMTGKDPMPEFRGQYTSEATAKQALRDIGSGTLYNTMRAKFGNPVPAVQANRGDIAWLEGCLGIIVSRYAIMIFADGRMAKIPVRGSGMKAWRVPFNG